MSVSRRDFVRALSAAAALGHTALSARADDSLYDIPAFGEARLIHTCDTHAQLLPVYFREPSANLGFGAARNKPPHLVGEPLLRHYGIAAGSRLAYALSHVNIGELAARYGKTGGFAHLASLVKRLRDSYGRDNTLHLDGGDMWQGSATALASGGADMAQAANLLGVDAMVGHWEFTYPPERQRANIAAFNGEFLGQNVFATEEALFEGTPVHDEDSGRVFPPMMVRKLGGRRVAVIGQCFPYTPISNPRRFIPNWTFGARRDELQKLTKQARDDLGADAVVLLSHNGSDLDLAVARDVSGIDFILGAHTHDCFYKAQVVNQTAVVNAGCVGKFVGCLDIAFGKGGVRDYRWRLLPVFANLLPEDPAMANHIAQTRLQHAAGLGEELATTDEWLYRRGNFNGSFDELILRALRRRYNADIALSPGFRWGTSVAAGDVIRMEDVMNATAMTYPETYSRQMRGAEIKNILEGVADNLYHPDPYYRQGGDMVRIGGLQYTLDPFAGEGGRISNLRLDDGAPLQANKQYTVAGWATQTPSDGAPVWEVLAEYLREEKHIGVFEPALPALKNMDGNLGIADYPAKLLL